LEEEQQHDGSVGETSKEDGPSPSRREKRSQRDHADKPNQEGINSGDKRLACHD
jgi:hypothetical protein